jgi:hypothetical protein
MRKLIVLIAAVAMVLMVAPAAFAGNGSGTGGGNGGSGNGGSKKTVVNYSLSGTVTSVDESSIDVTILKGNAKVRAYKGDTVTLKLTATTRLYERTVDGELVVVTLADFAAGDRITSVGSLNRSDPAAPVFTAKRVNITLPIGTCITP